MTQSDLHDCRTKPAVPSWTHENKGPDIPERQNVSQSLSGTVSSNDRGTYRERFGAGIGVHTTELQTKK